LRRASQRTQKYRRAFKSLPTIKEAGPSKPVEILGLPDVPEAGDRFFVVDEKRGGFKLKGLAFIFT